MKLCNSGPWTNKYVGVPPFGKRGSIKDWPHRLFINIYHAGVWKVTESSYLVYRFHVTK